MKRFFDVLIKLFVAFALMWGALSFGSGMSLQEFLRKIEFKNILPEIQHEEPIIEEPVIEEPIIEVAEGITMADVEALIAKITVGEPVLDYKYERDDFEQPLVRYAWYGELLTRNKYVWHISTYLVSEDPFIYMCPYSGVELTETTKVQTDHIVPLKYAFIHGAYEWDNEKKNLFSYDIENLISVSAKSNQSKGAKSPYEWLPTINQGPYCYTFLVICEKYGITMTQNEIDICKLQIMNYLSSGKELTVINTVKDEYK